MPVDSTHAFASGAAFRKPSAPPALAAWIGSRLAALALRSQVARVWQAFEAGATIAPGCRLGPSAWCVNEGPRDRIRIGAGSVCRGVLRRETFGDGTLILGEAVYVGDDAHADGGAARAAGVRFWWIDRGLGGEPPAVMDQRLTSVRGVAHLLGAHGPA